MAFSSVGGGQSQGSIKYPVVDIGSCIVKGAYNLAKGKKVPLAIAPGPLEVITEDNVSEILTWEEEVAERFGS